MRKLIQEYIDKDDGHYGNNIEQSPRRTGKDNGGRDVDGYFTHCPDHAVNKKIMDDGTVQVSLGRMVRYQKRGSRAAWHAFHLRLREDEYEYLLDLRKLLKMSVSLILAYAVKKYLDKLLVFFQKAKPGKCLTDNNCFMNYVIIKEEIQGVISWRLLWGFPPDIAGII
jgi:hypothetical protein